MVDVVDKEIKTENGGLFYGIYCTSLNRPWLCDSKTLLVSTPQRASVRSFKIDTGKIIIKHHLFNCLKKLISKLQTK